MNIPLFLTLARSKSHRGGHHPCPYDGNTRFLVEAGMVPTPIDTVSAPSNGVLNDRKAAWPIIAALFTFVMLFFPTSSPLATPPQLRHTPATSSPSSATPRPAASPRPLTHPRPASSFRPSTNPVAAFNDTAAVTNPALRKRLFTEANDHYNKGNYTEAIERYHRLYRPGEWENFAILYNLANCYHRLQRYGMALAFYKKAQRLSPNDIDLLHNLQILQRNLKKTPSSTELRIKFLFFWYYLLNLQQLFFVTLAFSALFFLFWAIHLRRTLRLGFGLRWSLASAAILGLLLWSSFGIKLYQEHYVSRGIVTSARITARSGYGEQFEAMFLLTEADEVIIKEKVDRWLRIEITLPDEKTKRDTLHVGWVPQDAIETI